MAAAKSRSAKTSATKRSTSAKTQVQEPAGTGHSPEAVPAASEVTGGPKRTKDGYAVAASAGNPHASRAGVIVSVAPPTSESRPKGELGLADIKVATVDGARARLTLGKETTGPLTQSDLVTLRKLLDGAIQETY